jgi:hypothetical protein
MISMTNESFHIGETRCVNALVYHFIHNPLLFEYSIAKLKYKIYSIQNKFFN